MDMWFDPLTDIFFRPLIRTPRQGADTAIKLLLEKDLYGVTGKMYASGKQKKISAFYNNHPQMELLWKKTKEQLTEYLK